MIRRLMRYSIDGGLWLALAGLFAAVLIHVLALFGVRSWERANVVFPLHLTLFGMGCFTVLMYKVRGEPYDPAALPSWSRRLLLVLFGYFLLSMVLARVENDKIFMLRWLSCGWLVGYAAVACYLWHLREALPRFDEKPPCE
jgi:ABC-type uncharacterized transport system permease subunit